LEPALIVRMREIIARSLDAKSAVIPQGTNALTSSSDQKVVAGRTFQNLEHLIFYERGVGTGPLLDRIKGGSFGDGLAGNIRRAYKFTETRELHAGPRGESMGILQNSPK